MTGARARARRWTGRSGLLFLLLLPALLLPGCVQSQWQGAGYGSGQTLLTADQTMDQELSDRVNRIARLSRLGGVSPPYVEQVTVLVPGASRPIPVIRVTFHENDFFSPGSALPRQQAAQILQVIAENMQRDVPDVRVTVLGHTDATGGVRDNQALSQARAQDVVGILVADGVNPGQLSAVAIGQAQPIASNNTAGGRARNRRVEFLISPSEGANLQAVSRRPVSAAFLSAGGSPVRSARTQVAVLKPRYSGPADFSEAPNAPRGRPGPVTLTASGPALTVGDMPTGSPVAGETVRPLTAANGLAPDPGDSGSPVGAGQASFKP